MKKDILSTVNKYYTDKIKTHGPTPAGVDWNSKDSQELRFEQLLKVVDVKKEFTLLDYGCGFGSLLDHMKDKFQDFKYTGFDISAEMLKEANNKFKESNARWIDKLNPGEQYDFTIASGIFNVRQDFTDADWNNYIIES